MIRTRDFILFVLVFLFLLSGAVFTGLADTASVAVSQPTRLESSPGLTTSTVLVIDEEFDEETLERLRSKFEAGEGVISGAPPVMTSVDSPNETTIISAATTTPAMPVEYCGAERPNQAVPTWPQQTEVRLFGSSVTVSETPAAVGTSTENRADDAYVTIPQRAVRSNFDSCLPDTTVGVTVFGQPLDNRTGLLYQNVPVNQVVGYTRDGFSVYGPVPDEAVLDTCGGQYINGSYQYHVRAESEAVISCYGGIPVSLQ